MKYFVFLIWAVLASNNIFAQASDDLVPIPIELIAIFDEGNLKDELSQITFLSDLDENYDDSPIALIVSLVNRDRSLEGAVGFTSLMITSGTLGLVPVVTNNDLIVRYELILHGSVISRHEFAENFRGADMIWDNGPNEPALTEAMMAWISSTVPLLKEAYDNDEGLAQLTRDYNYYFLSTPE